MFCTLALDRRVATPPWWCTSLRFCDMIWSKSISSSTVRSLKKVRLTIPCSKRVWAKFWNTGIFLSSALVPNIEVVTEFEKILKDCTNLFKRFDYQRVSPRIGYKVSAGDIHGSDKVEDKTIIQAILGRNLLFSFVRHRSPSLQITIPWP